ncbi:MAG TPA: hypothetical protein VEG34_03320 [Thermoanaerobaculia bacterium]|nr:hypothetical protein [Thermoanaerobaculia bacterium]
MLYEKLNSEMKEMVDRYAARLRTLDWRRRATLLAEAALPFGDDLAPDKARLAAQGFVTAVLERLAAGNAGGAGDMGDMEEVDDLDQARLFLLSLDRGHQALARRYLDENPEARAALEQEIADGSETPS